MQRIEIIPLVGVKFDEQMLALSATQQEVETLLGKPESVQEAFWYYTNSELCVNFDEEGRVEFIEFLAGIDGTLQPEIYGVSAFQTEAKKLYRILRKENGRALEDDGGYGYSFLKLSIGVFRDTTPADVKEMIRDARKDGEPMGEEEIEEEKRKANYWATIGIGIPGYYLDQAL